MAWKQDLAKLKQQLAPEDPGPAPKVLPRSAPKPKGPSRLEDEDAVFLSAMGLRGASPKPIPPDADAPPAVEPPVAANPVAAAAATPTLPPSPPPEVPDTFEAAVQELKGLKPLPRGLGSRGGGTIRRSPSPPGSEAPSPLPPSPEVAAPRPPEDLVEPLQVAPAPEPADPEVPLPAPLRFQLAAGMALEVDGILDLRGHSVPDAVGRLKDRLGDGQVLGWRSLQVTLGTDPRLHEGVLDLLASGQAPMVARYAQAPVPMGGNQAWLLYFGPTQPQS